MAQRLKTDWILFFTVLAMVFFGVLIVYSASAIMAQMGPNHSAWYFVQRQAAWAVIALIIMMALKSTHYRKLQNPAVAFSAISVSSSCWSRSTSPTPATIAGSASAVRSACSPRNWPSRRW